MDPPLTMRGDARSTVADARMRLAVVLATRSAKPQSMIEPAAYTATGRVRLPPQLDASYAPVTTVMLAHASSTGTELATTKARPRDAHGRALLVQSLPASTPVAALTKSATSALAVEASTSSSMLCRR
jgi:hypothetical protein